MRKYLLLLVMVVLALLLATQINGLQVTGYSVTLGCNSYDFTASTYVANRDNTGGGQEAWRVQVTDGAGTVLFEVNSAYTLGTGNPGGGTVNYTTAPQYNPIRYRWVSLAGNGFGEQVVYSTSGSCPGLPTLSSDSGDAGADSADAGGWFNPADGRAGAHPAATLNAYCYDYGLMIYRTDGSGTSLAGAVSRELIDEVGIPAENTLLTEAEGMQLYRLSDGLFQLMAAVTVEGKQDLVVFEVDFNNGDCLITRYRRGLFLVYEMRTIFYDVSDVNHWIGYPSETN